MEGLKELPEKWCIEVTKESIEALGKWRTDGPVGNMVLNHPKPHGYCSGPYGFYSSEKFNSEYKIITFEQFKKWVLKEESKFEVGKWYKYGDWYVKLKEIFDGNMFMASEYINNCRDYATNLNDFTCGDCNIQKVLLTDLSEIQQYLPEGHVDKLPKQLTIDDLVEGEVYAIHWADNKDGVFIFKSKKADGLCYSHKVSHWNDNEYKKDWNITERTMLDKIKTATPEEKRWLNVCITENKFVEKECALRGYDMHEKVLKSKVAKYYKCIKDVGKLIHYDTATKGKIYKTNETYILGDNGIKVCKPSSSIGVHCFIETTEEPINEPVNCKSDSGFVLSENWYIKPRNLKEAEIVGKWFDSQFNWRVKYGDSHNLHYMLVVGIAVNYGWGKRSDSVEITFDQFEEYVLKAKSKNNLWGLSALTSLTYSDYNVEPKRGITITRLDSLLLSIDDDEVSLILPKEVKTVVNKISID